VAQAFGGSNPPSRTMNGNDDNTKTTEVEALRLIDLEAGKKMRVSRNTVWRLVEAAREKLARAIIEGREATIHR